MIDKYPRADRILVAEIWDEEAVAVAAPRELADGGADSLAGVAGVLEGTSEGELDEPLAQRAKAGTEPEAMPAWIEEGRRRRAAARRPPFSGGLHR